MQTELDTLETVESYQTKHPDVFPSVYSLRWLLRNNRDELVKAEAVVRIGGRLFIKPRPFAETVLRIGARAATL